MTRSPSPKTPAAARAQQGECHSPVQTSKQQKAWLREAGGPGWGEPGLSPCAKGSSLSPQLMYPKKGLRQGDGSFTLLSRRVASSPRPTNRPIQAPRPVMPPKCASVDEQTRIQCSPQQLPRAVSTFVSPPSFVYGTPKLIPVHDEASQAAAAKAHAYRSAWESAMVANQKEARLMSGVSGAQTVPSMEGDECEFSEPRADLEGLLQYLDALRKGGARLTEVTYIVNGWTLGGIIPLRHHGFCVKCEEFGYLTLDFSRRGILWDTFEEYPDLPEGTIFAKKYHINVDPGILWGYCKDTKPFSWPGNDCSHWASGVMRVMRIVEDPFEDLQMGAGHCSCGPDRNGGIFSCGGGSGGGRNERLAVGCFS